MTSTATRPVADERAAPRRAWLVSLVVAAVLAVLASIAVFTPILAVRTVAVDGGAPAMQRTVREALADQVGTSLVRVDVDVVRARALESAPAASDARVERQWPGTLVVTMVPRQAVLSIEADGAVRAIDADGVYFDAKVPRTVPRLIADDAQGDALRDEVDSALTVIASLPEELDGRITQIESRSPDDIRLRINDGREVRWGGTADGAKKAAVLLPLLRAVKASFYDVSAPDLPTTRP